MGTQRGDAARERRAGAGTARSLRPCRIREENRTEALGRLPGSDDECYGVAAALLCDDSAGGAGAASAALEGFARVGVLGHLPGIPSRVAVGRKNHYWSRSERGTRVAALVYSRIESAKLCGVEPRAYRREATLRAVRNPGTATLARDLKTPEA